ncbi:hypothetical protein ATANTOWER_016185 [Ataeniobius toweri]|uniref:Uncharacterized protein n=1 Tax=Ataeniobius toweri TaxID=208326 RepID=A0ABU7AAL7_9TELE|nr:hypothetical protein [Ataeniobius toweri]
MATDGGSRGERVSNQHKPSLASPEKVRALLNEGVSAVDVDCNRRGDLSVLEVKSNTTAPCEATNNEAFFSRVESYSISFSRCYSQ